MKKASGSQEKVKLLKCREKIVKHLPDLGKVLRATFMKWYGECGTKGCRCHKEPRYQHGPYYKVSYSKKGKVYNIYVPHSKKNEVKEWINNYNRVWDGIEDVSEINIKLIRSGDKR